IIACRKSVRRVEANAERKLGASFHDGAQMFKPMPDAFSLARSVFKQNTQAAQIEIFASEFQSAGAPFYAIRFAGATRAARMDHEIINAKQNGALNFLPKRSSRFLEQHVVGCGQVDQIVSMN